MRRPKNPVLCPYKSQYCNSLKPNGDMMCSLCHDDYWVKTKETCVDHPVPSPTEGG